MKFFGFFTTFSLLFSLGFWEGSAFAQRGAWDQSTPRKAWKSFRDACFAEDYLSAGKIFSSKVGEQERKNAEKLCQVSDSIKNVDVNPENLSDETNPIKPTKTEEVLGYVSGSTKPEDRLMLVYKENEKVWVIKLFSNPSLDRWYENTKLQEKWIQDLLPEWLYKKKRLGLYLWQWLALPGLLILSFVVSFLIVFLLRFLLRPLLRKKNNFWNPDLLKRVRGPVRLLLATLLAQIFLPFLSLIGEVGDKVKAVLTVLSIWGGIWLATRIMSLFWERLQLSQWMRSHSSALTLMPLGLRFVRVLLWVIGIMLTLRALGFSITSLLAGVGLGGLAVALAAQKTVEQVLGGIILSVDQPMRVGDLIKVGDLTGTVESIGLRSTRIRTSDRTLLIIPNGKLAEMNIENFSSRDRMRFSQVLKLDYCTSMTSLQNLIEKLKVLVQEQPKIISSETAIHLRSFGDCSFEIEVVAYFQTTETVEFNQLRQELLLRLIQAVETQSSAWGLPSRAVQANLPKV